MKEGGAYFKVRGIIHMKFQNLVLLSLQVLIYNLYISDLFTFSFLYVLVPHAF